MATKRILLVRHGAFEGQSLTGLGRRQARLVARRLAEEPVTTIRSSTLRRAFETAEIISERFPALPIVRAHLLRECLPSVPAHWPKRRRRLSREWIRRGADRADRAFRRHVRPTRGADRCEVLVCHGNLIRYIVARSLRLRRTAWGTMATHHCAVSEIRVMSAGDVRLVSHNDVGHIPPSLRSS